MDDPLCPISTLELLDRTLSLYSRNFVKFAGLSMAGPMATFAYRLRYGGGTAAFVRLHSSTAAPAVLGVLVGIVIVLAGASISSAATVEAVAAVSRGSKVRVRGRLPRSRNAALADCRNRIVGVYPCISSRRPFHRRWCDGSRHGLPRLATTLRWKRARLVMSVEAYR